MSSRPLRSPLPGFLRHIATAFISLGAVVFLTAGCGDSDTPTASLEDGSGDNGFSVGDSADSADDDGSEADTGDESDDLNDDRGDGEGDADEGDTDDATDVASDGDDEGDEGDEGDEDVGDDDSTDIATGDVSADGDDSDGGDEGEDSSGTGDPFQVNPIGSIEEVEFEVGDSSAVREEEVRQGERNVYVLEAAAGQILTAVVGLDGGRTSLALLDPAGEVIDAGTRILDAVLEADGDYSIVVVTTTGDADYSISFGIRDQRNNEPDPPEGFPPLEVSDIDLLSDVEVGVNDEVRFEPGETSTVIQNAAIVGERHVYRLRADESQALFVDTSSIEQNTSLSLIAPSGEVLRREVDEINLQLSSTGEYWLIVGSKSGNTTYTLFINIV